MFNSLVKFPLGTLLLLICILNLAWFFYIWRRKPHRKLFIAYTLYVLSIVTWVLTNFYFHSELLTIYDKRLALIIALISNISACFSAVLAFYISCFIKSKSEKVSLLAWAFILIISFGNLFLNIYPDLTIQGVEIIDPHNFKLIQSPYAGIYFGFAAFLIIPSIINLIIAAIRYKGIRNKQSLYILAGALIMYFVAIFSNVIAPLFSQNYSFVWLPPLLSIVPIFLFGYAIFTQRFPSLKFIFVNLTKLTTIFILAGIVFYFLAFKLLSNLPIFYSQAIALVIFGLLIFNSAKLLGSETLQDLLIFNSVERFKREVFKLRNKKIVYLTLEDINNDLQEKFCQKFFISSAHIVPTNMLQKNYPELIKYSAKNLQTILVTKEIQLLENQQKNNPLPLKELENLGEICLPLFNPDQKLIGFFVLGRKPFQKPYTKEEIEAVEATQCHFSTVLSSVLHSTKLQNQLEAKNKILQKQNAAMRKLLAQQQDFIHVAAHELRTPVTICNATASVMPSSKKLAILQFGLDRLADRVSEIVYVYENHGQKMQPKFTKIKIQQFFQKVFKNFMPLLKKEERQFNFDNKIENPALEAEFDQAKIYQVAENLISNAVKFTKKNGLIIFYVGTEREKLKFAVVDNGCGVPDETKEEIFKKFRGNHATRNKGLGLGLYICRRIIKRHKGKIWCEDAPLKNGTAFCVEIPLKQSSPKEEPAGKEKTISTTQ